MKDGSFCFLFKLSGYESEESQTGMNGISEKECDERWWNIPITYNWQNWYCEQVDNK